MQPPEPEPRSPLTVDLPTSLLKRLGEESLKQDLAQVSIVREALEDYFDKIDTREFRWGP